MAVVWRSQLKRHAVVGCRSFCTYSRSPAAAAASGSAAGSASGACSRSECSWR